MIARRAGGFGALLMLAIAIAACGSTHHARRVTVLTPVAARTMLQGLPVPAGYRRATSCPLAAPGAGTVVCLRAQRLVRFTHHSFLALVRGLGMVPALNRTVCVPDPRTALRVCSSIASRGGQHLYVAARGPELDVRELGPA